MKDKKEIFKIIAPVVAVIVLAESVVLILSLNRQRLKTVISNQSQETTPVISPAVSQPVYNLTVSSAVNALQLNKAGVVEVKAVGNEDKRLDSISVYLKYDPEAFEISNLTFDKRLPVPAFSKVSESKGMVVATFLITEAKGLSVKQGEELTLMKFSAKPVKTGNFDFEISTGNGANESVTMFVENATSKVIPFSSDKLTVSVSR